MAKQDNFDFDTDSKRKFSLDLNFKFLEKFTESQKRLLLISAILIVVVIIACVICLIISANGGFSGNGGMGGNGGSGGVVEDGGNSGDEQVPEVPDEIVSFYISSTPSILVYSIGDEPNYTGLTVYLKSSVGSSMFINYEDDPSAFTITGFDSSKADAGQTITVECRGFTDTFTVTIQEPLPEVATLESISVTPLRKTTYKSGELLDLSGSFIICTYSDGTTESVRLRMKHISGFNDALPVGEHVLTVIYTDDNGGYAETTFTITVTE